MRYMRGFLQIQEMVDRAIIKLHTGSNMYSDMPSKLQMMPATCYQDDIFMGFVYPYIVPVVMTLAWLFAVAHCIKTITAYRECGLEEVCTSGDDLYSICNLTCAAKSALLMFVCQFNHNHQITFTASV